MTLPRHKTSTQKFHLRFLGGDVQRFFSFIASVARILQPGTCWNVLEPLRSLHAAGACWNLYGTTNTVYWATNADAGVGIGMLRGGIKNLIEKAIN